MKININNILINETSTIREAMRAISIGEIGVTISVELQNNRFIRIITDGDIRRALLEGYGLQSRINVIEKKESIVVGLDAKQSEVTAMFNKDIRIIPVLNDKQQVVDLYFHDKRNRLAVASPLFDDKEIELVNECMVSGWISSSGKFVNEFEESLAKYIGVKHAVSCSSGTSALHLILMAYGIGIGDEVIIPSLTFIATANAVTYSGAKPILIDSDIETWNIDESKIESAITKNTKAIIPVHLYGKPAKMDKIMEIADKYKIAVIEDAAEAHGAEVMNKKVGSIGVMGCFSFYGNKIITTGEGGMLVTNNKELYEKAQILRDHGMSLSKKYWHDLVGFNYRMTNMQAAIGCAQMEKVDGILKTKRNIGSMYNKFFSGHKSLILPKSDNFSKHIYWMYPVIFNLRGKDNNKIRDDIADLLKLFKIDSRPFFFPIHIMPPYYENCSLPVSEKLSLTGIVLPSYVGITNNEIKINVKKLSFIFR